MAKINPISRNRYRVSKRQDLLRREKPGSVERAFQRVIPINPRHYPHCCYRMVDPQGWVWRQMAPAHCPSCHHHHLGAANRHPGRHWWLETPVHESGWRRRSPSGSTFRPPLAHTARCRTATPRGLTPRFYGSAWWLFLCVVSYSIGRRYAANVRCVGRVVIGRRHCEDFSIGILRRKTPAFSCINLNEAMRNASPQKFAGVFALMISASSAPIFRNLCGNVVGK